MKCYTITLLATLLIPSMGLASDFEFCRQRTVVVFDLYTKLENGQDVPPYSLEGEIAKNWWNEKLGSKMDLVQWYYTSCLSSTKREALT